MTVSIHDYAIVGDCRSAALISRGGSCDWLCWPRFDSPSLFGALLDEERGGRFLIAPAGPFTSTRRYLPGTNVLQTRFETPEGAAVTLTDFMPVPPLAQHELLRIVECERGECELEIVFDPRPDYGRLRPRLRHSALGLRAEVPGGGLLTLLSEEPLTPRVRIRAGERRTFSLTCAFGEPAVLPPPSRALEALAQTAELWRAWSRATQYDGPHRDAVLRSALVLKLLQYAPSGAIVAAPTTSLPERRGGALNWDYRFCWLRDAALTVRALYGLGHHDEAEAFLSWLLNATSLSAPKLRVLYDVFGRRPRAERELSGLSGHGGALPVRVGNAAMDQIQLDTYGEVIEAAAYFVKNGGALDSATARLLIGFGEEVADHFDEPDEGIWEERGTGRHFTHSHVLCWAALQRLLELHEQGHLPRAPAARFRAARDRLREEIETLGYSEQLQTYTRTLGGADVDASLLLLPWYGYAEASSPRMQGTWRRIRERLGVDEALLRRYYGPLTKGEAAFGICSFWEAEFLALGGGTLQEAEAHLSRLIAMGNDVGLFGEEIEPGTGAALGNFPQAFTHVGLINAALSLRDRAARGAHETHAPLEARP